MKGPKVMDTVAVMKRGGLSLFLNPDAPDWFVGNDKAAATVALMDGTRSLDSIVSQLGKAYGLPAQQLKADAEELVRLMRAKGMLEDSPARVDGGAPDFRLRMMWLHVTHRCNLRCKYCYVTAGEALQDELTTDEMRGLIDQFHSMGAEGQTIAVSGGEPLLRDDLWEIVTHARRLGIRLMLATNGMLVDEAIARRIKEDFVSVQISLDGPRAYHDAMRGKGSYDGAIRAIGLLVRAGVRPYVNAVVTRDSAGGLPEVVRTCHEHGLESVKSPPLLAIGKGDSCLAPALAELARAWWAMDRETRALKSKVPMDNIKSAVGPPAKRFGYGCGAGVNSISVDSDGRVYPCQGAQRPEFLAGNIRKDCLARIWDAAPVLADWRRAFVANIPGCSGCEWRNYCGGGCRLHAWAASGTICAPDRYCEMYKRMFEESIWASTLRKLGRDYDPDELWARAVDDLSAIDRKGKKEA